MMSEDPDEQVKLTRVRAEVDAALIVAALIDRGIQARYEGGLVSEFRSEFSAGVDIFVRRADLERARTILQEIESSRSDS
jgi:hypothetical protein